MTGAYASTETGPSWIRRSSPRSSHGSKDEERDPYIPALCEMPLGEASEHQCKELEPGRGWIDQQRYPDMVQEARGQHHPYRPGENLRMIEPDTRTAILLAE